MQELTLYGSFTSPYVRHCRIALLETGLECQFSEADTNISARLSPMQKVPFLSYKNNNSDFVISDSAAIIKLIREQKGNSFMSSVEEFNLFCAANTLLDTALNLFFLEKDGIISKESSYIQRQESRIQSALLEFEKLNLPRSYPFNDFHLRLACALDWSLYRKRFSLEKFPNLYFFLESIRDYSVFFDTQPPKN